MKIVDYILNSVLTLVLITGLLAAFAIWGPEPPRYLCIDTLNCWMPQGDSYR